MKPVIQPTLVVLTILVGLVVDRHGGAWGQPLVSLWVWLLFGVLMFQAAALRLRLFSLLLHGHGLRHQRLCLRAQVRATGLNTKLPGVRVFIKQSMSARSA
mgnify:CR=1 FL=1